MDFTLDCPTSLLYNINFKIVESFMQLLLRKWPNLAIKVSEITLGIIAYR